MELIEKRKDGLVRIRKCFRIRQVSYDLCKTFKKLNGLKMVKFSGIYLCDYPMRNICLRSLKVGIEAKLAQISLALFSFALISSCLNFFS